MDKKTYYHDIATEFYQVLKKHIDEKDPKVMNDISKFFDDMYANAPDQRHKDMISNLADTLVAFYKDMGVIKDYGKNKKR